MAKLLITGGAGFIGLHTCLDLLEKNHEIIVIDSYINSSPRCFEYLKLILNNFKFEEKLKIICGDIRSSDLIKNVFQREFESGRPIEGVIHFAGLKSVLGSIENPSLYWDVNFDGSKNLFNIMEKFSCKTIVFSSSATIYKVNDYKLINEKHEINPTNPYGETKAAVEELLKKKYLENPKDWKIINLRYFNPIGAHVSGNIGEAPKGMPDNLFPYICKVAAKKLDKLYIFGNDWNTNDGTALRDYIHVMDIAEAHTIAINKLLKISSEFININLGTSKGTSVLELVNSFIQVNKCQIPFEFKGRRKGDMPFVVSDNKLAKEYLDWEPKRTIKNMCKDGWIWQSKHPNGYA